MTNGVTSLPSFAQSGNRLAGGAASFGANAGQTGSFESLLDSVQARSTGEPSAAPVPTATASVPADATGTADPTGSADPTAFLFSGGMGKSGSRKTSNQLAEDKPSATTTATGDIAAMAQAVLLASGPVQLPTPAIAAAPAGVPGQEAVATTVACRPRSRSLPPKRGRSPRLLRPCRPRRQPSLRCPRPRLPTPQRRVSPPRRR